MVFYSLLKCWISWVSSVGTEFQRFSLFLRLDVKDNNDDIPCIQRLCFLLFSIDGMNFTKTDLLDSVNPKI